MNLIYDNIVFQLQHVGGISSYWSQLIERLQRDRVDVKFLHSANANLAAQRLNINSNSIIEGIKKPVLVNRFSKPALTHVQTPFIFHSSYNRVSSNKYAINIITVHDFIHEKFYGGFRKALHCFQKKGAINTSRRIITVSENTKLDLLTYYPNLAPQNIKVIYNGVSDEFHFLSNKQGTGKPFLIFIGSRQPYKNFKFVVQLIREMEQFDLYIVGKNLTPDEKHLVRGVDGRIKLFTDIDDGNLNALYNAAFALIYPSSYEGFGLPILEAMKAGLPFVAYKTSSIPEVAGDAGELIEKIDIDLVKEALNKIASKRSEYVIKGFNQSSNFSWEKCYKETLNLYEEAFKE